MDSFYLSFFLFDFFFFFFLFQIIHHDVTVEVNDFTTLTTSVPRDNTGPSSGLPIPHVLLLARVTPWSMDKLPNYRSFVSMARTPSHGSRALFIVMPCYSGSMEALQSSIFGTIVGIFIDIGGDYMNLVPPVMKTLLLIDIGHSRCWVDRSIPLGCLVGW